MTKSPSLTAAEQKAARLVAKLKERERYFALEGYTPYPKQKLFHDLGATKHERALIAANRSGKSYSAGAEIAMHLTGIYPAWWAGRRFAGPTRGWAAGKTGLSVRDVGQKILFGTPGVVSDRGTGMVPRQTVDWERGTSTAHGYSGLFDTVQVKHKTGGVSTVRFMTYEQGREKWQGETLDWIWCDEEPPMDLYSEGLTRHVHAASGAYPGSEPLSFRGQHRPRLGDHDNRRCGAYCTGGTRTGHRRVSILRTRRPCQRRAHDGFRAGVRMR